jgi:MFS family permease
VFFLDSVGRRPLLMIGATGCFVSLVMVGSLVAAFGHAWPSHVSAGRVAIGESMLQRCSALGTASRRADCAAFVYIYDVFFSFSWAPIGWVLPSEIFNLATRSTGVSITTSCTWMSNL